MTNRIIGDIAEGQKWYGVAEQVKRELMAIYRNNNAFMHVWKPVSSTVTIYAKMVNRLPVAYIFTTGSFIYLDSGVVEFSTAVGNIDTYRPGILHYTDRVHTDSLLPSRLNGIITAEQAVLSITSSYLGRSALSPHEVGALGLLSSGCLDNERTVSFGNKYSSRTSTSTDLEFLPILPETAHSFSGGEHEFNSTNSQIKRYCADYFLPSTLTGRGKLFLQALYGSEFTSFEVYITSDLQFAGFYCPTSEAYTGAKVPILPYDRAYNIAFVPDSSSYKIFFMMFVTDQYRIYSMEPANQVSKDLLKKYEEISFLPREDRIKAEAIILASCRITALVSDWITFFDSTGLGSFPAYSWKFDSTGTKGVGVLYIENASPSYYVKATKVELDIGLEIVDGVLNHNVSATVNLSKTFSSYLTPIHAPVGYGAALHWVGGYDLTGGDTVDDALQAHTTAIVYSFFDEYTDNIIDIEVGQDVTKKSAGVASEIISNTLHGAVTGLAYSSINVNYIGGFNGVVSINVKNNGGVLLPLVAEPHGFTAKTGIEHTGTGQVADAYSILATAAELTASGMYRWTDGSYREVPQPTTPNARWSVAGGFIFREIYNYSYASGSNTNIARQSVCIPIGDASSGLIYDSQIRHEKAKTWAQRQTIGGPAGAQGNGERATLKWRVIANPFGLPLETFSVDLAWGGSLAGYGTEAVDSGTVPAIDGDFSKVYLVGGSLPTTYTLLEDLSTTPGMFFDMMTPWSPSAIPLPLLSVRQSMREAWRTYHGVGTNTKNNDYANNVSVGWA